MPGAALAALAGFGLPAPPPAHAAYMIPGGTLRPKDFSLVKKDGYYHLFYIRNNTALSPDSTERDLGHAVSTDLFHWAQLPPVMPVRPGHWDNLHVWAPHVFEHEGLWWMFYTGVTHENGVYDRTQRTGVAVSSDLVNWNRYDSPVLDSGQTSWAWWAPGRSTAAFRDPFVMPDPAAPGAWLMYYTASLDGDTAATVVGVAASGGDLLDWFDVKPLLVTWRAYTYNVLTESPHVFQRNGLWYLFISTTAGQPLSFYTSANPVGDPWEWTYRGRLRNMLGFDTSTWFASEYYRDGTHDLFCFVNGDRIELRKIQWGAGWQFSLVQPPLLHVVSMEWAEPVVHTGEHATLKTTIANPLAGTVLFEALVVDSNGVETVVPPESLGFNPAPQVWSDTSYIPWVARRWPAVPDGDTTTVTRFRFRCADRTAESGVLTVRGPRPAAPPAPEGPPPPEPEIPPDPEAWRPNGAIMRTLASTPLGPGPALAVELRAPLEARVEIYDLTGRRVRRLADRVLPAGVTVLRWDGRDESGGQAPRGLYFARLAGPGVTAVTRLTLLPR